MNRATILDEERELAQRAAGGYEVSLLWDTAENSTSIEIRHTASEETLRFSVPKEAALDAFYHPFAHLTRRAA